MSREELINTTRAILAKAGFDVSSALALRSICFDIVGKKDETLLIVKVLTNVDAFSRDNAEEMKILADALGANPLLIGENSSSGPLENGIVYSRFKIPIISNQTLAEHLLEEVPPFIFAAPGGLYVKISSSLLKELRESNNISLGTLAETAGVSRRTIQMYEAGMGAMIDAALRLEEFLNVPIIEPLDPFEYKRETKTEEYNVKTYVDSQPLGHMAKIGFTINPVIKSPFEAVTNNSQITMLTGIGAEEEKLIQKALITAEISRITGIHSLIIVEKKPAKDNIDNTAIVTKEELKKIDDQNELADIVKSRSTKK
jgi:putative transcriptional regulator